MADYVVLLIDRLFEHYGKVGDRLAKPGDLLPFKQVTVRGREQEEALKNAENLVVVTVRPNDVLLRVGLLEGVRNGGAYRYFGMFPNGLPVRRLTKKLVSKLTLASGEGVSWKKGKLAETLAIPLELTEADMALLRMGDEPVTPPVTQKKGSAKTPTTPAGPELRALLRNQRHSAPVRAVLEARHARFEGERPTRASSEKRLREHRYVPHESALEFDVTYGGLIFAGESTRFDGKTPVGADWTFDDTAGWTVGPSACLASGAHKNPRENKRFRGLYGDALQLVPVAYGPADDIYFVDGAGRGWWEDTTHGAGGPHLVAHDLRQLFAHVVLQHWLLTRRKLRQRDARRGALIAERYGLKKLNDASDRSQTWWGRGRTLVCEMIDLPMRGGPPVRWMTWAASDDPTFL